MVLWFCGFVVLWFYGFVVLWFCGCGGSEFEGARVTWARSLALEAETAHPRRSSEVSDVDTLTAALGYRDQGQAVSVQGSKL